MSLSEQYMDVEELIPSISLKPLPRGMTGILTALQMINRNGP